MFINKVLIRQVSKHSHVSVITSVNTTCIKHQLNKEDDKCDHMTLQSVCLHKITQLVNNQ